MDRGLQTVARGRRIGAATDSPAVRPSAKIEVRATLFVLLLVAQSTTMAPVGSPLTARWHPATSQSPAVATFGYESVPGGGLAAGSWFAPVEAHGLLRPSQPYHGDVWSLTPKVRQTSPLWPWVLRRIL